MKLQERSQGQDEIGEGFNVGIGLVAFAGQPIDFAARGPQSRLSSALATGTARLAPSRMSSIVTKPPP
jgi:hypothetical protein